MAHGDVHDYHRPQEVSQVLVIRQPISFSLYQSKYAQKFQFLKAWESPLPLNQFLTTHARKVQILLSCGTFPLHAYLLHLLPSQRLIVPLSAGLNHIDRLV
ncbi:hypothetical protein CJ030_MR3G018281 [Morella rubra]|uniref:Uncharacterized protein n=1 Tax=Morella rubra TaxID=262757 RepID=A0A6A1W0U6_9ROSI|nr:hypothetical protein CJ030_MR3G018281 [Morella rubra]